MRRFSGIGPWILGIVAGSAAAAIHPVFGGFLIAAAITLVLWRRDVVGLGFAAVAAIVVRMLIDRTAAHEMAVLSSTITPSVLIGLGLVAYASVIGAKRIAVGLPIWPDPLAFRAHVWLVAAYAIGLIATLVQAGLGFTLYGARELLRVASIVGAFLLVWWFASSSQKARRAAWWMLGAGLLIEVAICVAQLTMGVGLLHEATGLDRLQGTFSHPNTAGVYFGSAIPVIVAIRFPRSPFGYVLRVSAIVFLVVLLALTFSRTGLLVAAVTVVALIVLRQRPIGSHRFVAIVGALIGLTLVTWVVGGQYLGERFGGLSLNRQILDLTREGVAPDSFVWRLVNWIGLISMGARHPVMGHGLGLASVLNPLINPDTGTPFSAHNDFVRFFFESGVLGLLCYVMYGVYMTRWIMKVVERNRNAQQAPLGPALAAVWIGLFFLTGGAVELSVQTALLFQTYALAAVISSKHGQTSRPLSHERTQMPTPQ